MNDWQQFVSKSLSNFRNFKDNEYKSKIDESSELIINSLKDLDQKFRLENNNEEFINDKNCRFSIERSFSKCIKYDEFYKVKIGSLIYLNIFDDKKVTYLNLSLCKLSRAV
ncbi:hypothetical protein BpHYR1_023853 [Brachionus plicatilis]|uniref:Uncharacterized protein n=1 Tax=Brachionus plicatilis TaxID=10195 RepID=A0A3M7RW91_BRAPC|nr:hypothetical protein BpHYR1_023853 [Brachionus plicatilis]